MLHLHIRAVEVKVKQGKNKLAAVSRWVAFNLKIDCNEWEFIKTRYRHITLLEEVTLLECHEGNI